MVIARYILQDVLTLLITLNLVILSANQTNPLRRSFQEINGQKYTSHHAYRSLDDDNSIDHAHLHVYVHHTQ